MSADPVEIRIAVSGEDDPVRDERAARALRDDLLALDDVLDAGFALADDVVPPVGAKGPPASDTVVLVTHVAPWAATTVIAFIHAWANRSSRRRITMSSDGSFEARGGINRRDERLLRDLRGPGRGSDGGREGAERERTGDDGGG